MDKEQITLKAHQPQWTELFEQEARRLKQALPDHLIAVHHIGSTAVASIRAKPIIDIAVESGNYPPGETVERTLADLGYTAHGESGVPKRCWFTKGMPRLFNLHWCPDNGSVVRAQLRFRDLLRQDSKLASEYELLKCQAAKVAKDQHIDSCEYAEAKRDFISSVLKK